MLTALAICALSACVLDWSRKDKREAPDAGQQADSSQPQQRPDDETACDADGGAHCSCDAGLGLGADGEGCESFAWSVPVLLEIRDDGDVGTAQVLVDAQGNATAVWDFGDCCTRNIWSNRYEPGNGWLGATQIESNAGAAHFPRAAVDGHGDVLLAWYVQETSDGSALWSAHAGAQGAWSSAARISTGVSAFSHDVAVALGVPLLVRGGTTAAMALEARAARGWTGESASS